MIYKRTMIHDTSHFVGNMQNSAPGAWAHSKGQLSIEAGHCAHNGTVNRLEQHPTLCVELYTWGTKTRGSGKI